MVKSTQPLQIRLTEPVIFLRGPSTGLDNRGRPQVVRQDAQPAMLRGLLTLRLTKPTRVRSITIALEGKARTEWPEGLGAHRLETAEEHEVISETTTFYNAKSDSARSKFTRRAASVGPGALSRYDQDDETVEEDTELHGIPGEGEDLQDWVSIIHRSRAPPRSASAMPSTHDESRWHRHGYSRRPSLSRDDSQSVGLVVAHHDSDDRGPSPAYTPSASDPPSRRSSFNSARTHSPLAGDANSIPLSLASAVTSRLSFEHRDSAEAAGRHNFNLSLPEGLSTEMEPQHRPSVLNGSGSSGEVRFAERARHQHEENEDEEAQHLDGDRTAPLSRSPESGGMSLSRREERASLIRSSLPTSNEHNSGDHQSIPDGTHLAPTGSGIPILSDPSHSDSVRREALTETQRFDSSPSFTSEHDSSSLRRASLYHRLVNSVHASPVTSPNVSTTDLTDTRGRRRSHMGGGSTIDTDPYLGTVPVPSSSKGVRSASDTRPGINGSTNPAGGDPSRETTPDGRSHHNSSKFSLAAAFRGLSKPRGVSKGRTPSMTESFLVPESSASGRKVSGKSLSNHVRGDQSPGGLRTASLDQDTAPYGRGGAGSRSRSRNRTASPAESRKSSPDRGRGRHIGMKLLTDKLRGTGDHEDTEEDAHNWKEFRKGTYNYPISFPIPITAPPTVHAEFGSVTYRLNATVVRVGALTSNLVEHTEVIMIATPQEDDLEESENVLVERQWEEQMRYQIVLSGKAFPIGGIIPISIRLMPLSKCKIHRISVVLEEKADFYAQEKKVARHEAPRRFVLLLIKQPDKLERVQPLLPILSEDPNAARDSPLAALAKQAYLNSPTPPTFETEDNEDSMYATLLDPQGPWHLEKDLQVPDCATAIKFTTKHDKTNITIGHWLKITLRVERGDDFAVDDKGRRKQFDIIIETPIKILDCRVNPQWNSLPTYAARNPLTIAQVTGVCSVHSNRDLLPHGGHATNGSLKPDTLISASSQSRSLGKPSLNGPRDQTASASRERGRQTDVSVGAPRDTRGDPQDTLLERNIVYDRLMSGQETESGEHPPSYGEAVQSARGASRSVSHGTSGRGSNGI